jgi:hypothetical protein
VSRGVDLLSRDDSGGICPGYEFIGIPYNGWGCESPFVADVLVSGTIIRSTLKTPNSQLVTPISTKLQRPDGCD